MTGYRLPRLLSFSLGRLWFLGGAGRHPRRSRRGSKCARRRTFPWRGGCGRAAYPIDRPLWVALDRTQILNLLLPQLRLSLILITHDLDVLKHMTDRSLVMHRGRVVESGLTESVLENPQNPYTVRYLQSSGSRS